MSTLAPILDPAFTVAATICSILPREDGQDHTVFLRTHGAYVVKHPHEGEAYKLTHVTHKVDYADVGDYDPAKVKRTGVDPRKQYHFDAKSIADDICKQHNENAAGNASFFGLFVCKGNEPTEEELEAANKRLNDYFRQCVVAADAQWSDAPVHNLISGVAKRAGRWLKLDPENHGWMSSFQVKADCPACGERIKLGVAICKACGAILDEKKAAKFHIISKEHKAKAKVEHTAT